MEFVIYPHEIEVLLSLKFLDSYIIQRGIYEKVIKNNRIIIKSDLFLFTIRYCNVYSLQRLQLFRKVGWIFIPQSPLFFHKELTIQILSAPCMISGHFKQFWDQMQHGFKCVIQKLNINNSHVAIGLLNMFCINKRIEAAVTKFLRR